MAIRKAFLVGINDYAPVGAGGPDLRGCVNDVRDMASTLSGLGIVPAVPASMRIATDARATRAAILDGLKWLVTGAKKGDLLIFHYSGHGSQMVDTSGEEPDSRDETICPHDFASAGMIRDDDLRSIFRPLAAGVNLDVFLDSCHSGTGTREALALQGLAEEEAVTYRYVEPPLDWGFFLEANPTLPARGLMRWAREPIVGIKQAVEVPTMNHVLWAGCRDNQTSAEAKIGGVYRGVFTYCFCRKLNSAGIAVTRRRLDSLVSSCIKAMGYGQVPQLEGTKASLNEKVFT